MRRAYLLGLFAVASAFAGPKLYLKTRVIDTSDSRPSRLVKRSLPRALNAGRVHLLIQYDHAPDSRDTAVLAGRGATVLGYVHENGLVISTGDAAALDGLRLQWVGEFAAADKISPLLPQAGAGDAGSYVVVEFHPDANLDDARREVVNVGAALVDNPDLGPRHLLAYASMEQAGALAELDEVAYIFPASADLAAGREITACVSALTPQGVAGQYIPKMGDGWDGPGKGAASVLYYFGSVSAQLPPDSVRSEILRAFAEWAKYVKVSFAPAPAADGARTIDIVFAKRDHGDGYPFDGPGGVLAHSFYPSPPNPEPLAGDMHFDDDEMWHVGIDKDLFSVALHEAGHALGLGHSDRPGAVMYPYYAQATGLSADDIGAIQDLYAAQDGATEAAVPPPAAPAQPPTPPAAPAPPPTTPVTPATPALPTPVPPLSLNVAPVPATTNAAVIPVSGSISGGSGSTVLSWSTDKGQSGSTQGLSSWTIQIPLALGANSITFTAIDAQRATVWKNMTVVRQAVASPVAIQLMYPAGAGSFATAQAQVNIRGTASHSSGIQRVAWSSDRGPSGVASGTADWDSGSIALQSGVTRIDVTATANDGTVGTAAVQIAYTPPGPHDTTAPSLTILSPASATLATPSDSIVVRGTAADNTGVTSVAWFTSAGASGEASGTTNWATPPIPLIRGDNSIVIRAFDAAGNMAWRSINITRQ